MLLVIETNKGAFEAPTKRNAISQMVEFFTNENQFCYIKSIVCILDHLDNEKKICDKVIGIIEENVNDQL